MFASLFEGMGLVLFAPLAVAVVGSALVSLAVLQLFPGRVKRFVNYELHRAFHRMYPYFIRAPRGFNHTI